MSAPRSLARVGVGLAIALLVASAAPASAQLAPGGDVVVLTGPVHVAEDDLVGSLVVLQGPTRIDGFVPGDVIAIGGDVDVSGTIGGDLVVIGGATQLADGATVQSDVISPRPPSIEQGAFVGGAIRPLESRAPVIGQVLASLASWVAMTASLIVLALLALALVPPRTGEAVYLAARRAPARALALGLLVALAVPALAWAAMVTLVGIPLGLATFLAIAFFSACGYVAAAWVIGHRIADTPTGARWATGPWSRLVTVLLGLAILRALALVPILDLAVWVLASAFGVGAIAMALFDARKARPAETPPLRAPLGEALPA